MLNEDYKDMLLVLYRSLSSKGEKMNLNLEKMTIEEKIQAMEMLWDDFCKKKPDFQSPGWHKDILLEREKKLKEGKDKFMDWEIAKKEIRASIS